MCPPVEVRSVPLKVKASRWQCGKHFDSWLKQNLCVWTVHRVDKYSFCAVKRNSTQNHQQQSAIISKYIKLHYCSLAHGLTTWLYCAGSSRARAKSSKFYSSSMIYERKITMWRNFLIVWFFMQNERWAFTCIILFRTYFIFVHRIRFYARGELRFCVKID